MSHNPFSAFLAVVAGVLLHAVALATPFSSVYVFGDSLSDAGNSPSAVMSIYTLLGNNCDPFHPCPPYVDGHYSNGPTAAEYLANTVLPGGANPTNFVSFAVSGSTTGIGNFGDGGGATAPGLYGLPGMVQQLGLYQSLSGGSADPAALYVVWAGANDFLTFDNPVDGAQRVAGYVGALANMGARRILVPNLPDLSLTPFVQSVGLQSQAQGFSMAFNNALALQIAGLDMLFPTVDFIAFDTFAFLNEVVAHPASYGFADVDNACLLDPACTDANQYLFWDDFHPTTRAHAVIAAAFARAVPEPAMLAVFALGLVLLLASRGLGRYRQAMH